MIQKKEGIFTLTHITNTFSRVLHIKWIDLGEKPQHHVKVSIQAEVPKKNKKLASHHKSRKENKKIAPIPEQRY